MDMEWSCAKRMEGNPEFPHGSFTAFDGRTAKLNGGALHLEFHFMRMRQAAYRE